MERCLMGLRCRKLLILYVHISVKIESSYKRCENEMGAK